MSEEKYLEQVKGVIPPLITPFAENGDYDAEGMEKLLSLIEPNVDGLFVCGTYGSGPLMDIEERKEVLESVVDISDSSTPIIAHVGASESKNIIELAKHAEEKGAIAVATVIPFYYTQSYSEENILNFFSELVNSIEIPVFLYNNPKTTGQVVDLKLLQKLSEVGVKGVKDSTFDLLNFYSCKFKMDLDEFKYVIGTEALIVPTVPLGAVASVSGLANAYPEVVKKLYDAVEAGDNDKVFDLQYKVNHLREIQHFTQSIPAIHAMLEHRGVDIGSPRFPFQEASDRIKVKIKNAIDDMNLNL